MYCLPAILVYSESLIFYWIKIKQYGGCINMSTRRADIEYSQTDSLPLNFVYLIGAGGFLHVSTRELIDRLNVN